MRFASAISGFLANFSCTHFTVWSIVRPYIQNTSPSAKKFLQRSISDGLILLWVSALRVSDEKGTLMTDQSLRVLSSRGLDFHPAFFKFSSLNESELTTTRPPLTRSPKLTLSAAEFITTSTSGASPAVNTSFLLNWIWKLDTPGSV